MIQTEVQKKVASKTPVAMTVPAPAKVRSWCDVAASEQTHPPRPPVAWVVEWTVFLTPGDTSLRNQNLDKNQFGAKLQDALGAMVRHETPTLDCIIESLARTSVGLFKVQLAAAVIGPVLGVGEIAVDGFGVWKVEKMRESSAPSIVLMGVDLSVSDEAVAQGAMLGSRGELPEGDRSRLGHLRTHRMFRQAPQWPARWGRSDGEMPASSPTRNVRLYGDPSLLDRFLASGFVKMNWDIVHCRAFEPPCFFWKK